MAAKKYPLKLIGQIGWFGGPDGDVQGPTPVKRAIQRSPHEFVLGCEFQGYKYSIALTSSDGIRFNGSFVATHGFKKSPVDAEATLYSNADGCLLFGRWVEDDAEFFWYAELHPVEVFPDENESH